jgi:DNA-binding response OmpR family regulator
MQDESILVVDDSPTILKLVEMTLAKAGFRVSTADCGELGILAATERPPDLLLLDYLLPDLNGDDVCRAISGNVALATVPVVVMSAKGEEAGACFSSLASVVDILPKPFSPDALLAVVHHALEKHRREPTPLAGESPDNLDVAGLLPKAQEDKPTGLPIGPDGAALVGDLSVVSIADVLLLLQDRQHSGALRLTGEKASIEICVNKGRIDFAGAQGVADEFLLGHFLVRGGQIDRGKLDEILEERRAAPGGGLLGADLCRRGLITEAGLRRAMAQQTTALVFEGLRWGEGLFSFHPAAEPSPAAREATLGLPIDGLIMQGLRRVDEWRVIGQEIDNFDIVFVRNEDKIASFDNHRLLREEAAILEIVNGKNTVRDIIQLSKMGSYDVTQVLFRLLRCKFIRRRVAPMVG